MGSRNSHVEKMWLNRELWLLSRSLFSPYQYGLNSNLIGMGGGRHVFFNFDFLITFETFYNKNLVAEWLGQLTFDLKDPGSNPVFGKFFFLCIPSNAFFSSFW